MFAQHVAVFSTDNLNTVHMAATVRLCVSGTGEHEWSNVEKNVLWRTLQHRYPEERIHLLLSRFKRIWNGIISVAAHDARCSKFHILIMRLTEEVCHMKFHKTLHSFIK